MPGISCAIVPKIRNNNNEIVESKLFSDLLDFTSNNRVEAKRLYTIVKSDNFTNKWLSKMTLDENGEPTIKSLLDKTNLKTSMNEEKVLEALNKKIGHYKRGEKSLNLVTYTDNNYTDLKQRAIAFNSTSEFKDDYVAVVNKVQEEGADFITKPTLNIEVQRKNSENTLISKKMEKNEALNARIRQILASNGISVGALTELEERMGINGVADFDMAEKVADGTVEFIRLAKGFRGEQALPEEFSHLALEALDDNPIVKRVLSLLSKNDSALAQEILGEEYDDYREAYKEDDIKLAKEAAGKLLARHLLKTNPIPKNKPYTSLLERLINTIKRFFGNLDELPIQRARLEADREFGRLAEDLINGELGRNLNIRNIKLRGQLYSLEERVKRDRKLLANIIKTEQKRLNIYRNRTHNKEFNKNQEEYLNKLQDALDHNRELEGINLFIQQAGEIAEQLYTRLETIMSDDSSSIAQRASVLRDIRNYTNSYKGMISELRGALLSERRKEDDRFDDKARENLDRLILIVGDIEAEYDTAATPLFTEFIKPFFGEKLVVPFGKNKGKVITVEDLIKEADRDISFFDRWLDSMADSSDYMLKLFDQAVKMAKEQGRMKWIKLSKAIKAAGVKLERAGIHSFEWMFEKDNEGNLTGNYISEINEGQFLKDKNAMLKRIKEKYGEEPTGEDLVKAREEEMTWKLDHMDGQKPKASLYTNPAFKSLNAAQREFYRTIMDIKASLDELLPEDATTLNNAVKIRKDLIERVKRQGLSAMVESIKDSFLRRSDDTEFGERAVLQDFEGNQVQTLPIYYTKLREEQKDKNGKVIRKAESPNDMSTDVVSTMIAYAQMALDYGEMNKIIDVLEVGRDLMKNRQIQQTSGGKPLVESIKSKSKEFFNKLTKQGDATHFMQRLNDFFEMQVYGRYISDEGNIFGTNLDWAKTINNLNSLTAINTLALNSLAGVSNIETGKVMMRIESFSKEYFTETNTLHADKNYASSILAFTGEIGKRVKTNKLSLWNEYFNVLQDYERESKNTNWDRKSRFAQLCESDTLFFMQNSGEHWMQTRTSLALADNYKMRDKNGNIVTLWEAMEVVPIDGKDLSLGAKIQVKEGYTKEDGSEFTEKDAIRFSRRCAAINQRMHGIYNYIDKSAIQKIAIGRSAILFRKWIKPSLNRRWGGITYNFDLDAWVEGYYRTTGRFMNQLAKDLRRGQISIAANWNNLTNTEKANIRRCLTEVGHFLVICAAVGLLGSIKYKDWDDDDPFSKWAFVTALYQAKRLQTEIGMFVPSPFMPAETLTIIKSPMANINQIESSLALINLLNPYNYEFFAGEDAIMKSGRYKGKSKATKYLLNSPLAPMYKTISRAAHPEEAIKVFNLTWN